MRWNPSQIALGVLIAAALLLSPKAALARDFKLGSIEIEHPWSRATPGGAAVAVGYLTVKNSGGAADRLVSATAEIAGRTEIHLMSMADGVMQMRAVPEGVAVPAGGEVALEPGSYHLMFLDLKHPLNEGADFAGSLTFEGAGTVEVTFHVEKTGAAAPASSEHQGH